MNRRKIISAYKSPTENNKKNIVIHNNPVRNRFFPMIV